MRSLTRHHNRSRASLLTSGVQIAWACKALYLHHASTHYCFHATEFTASVPDTHRLKHTPCDAQKNCRGGDPPKYDSEDIDNLPRLEDELRDEWPSYKDKGGPGKTSFISISICMRIWAHALMLLKRLPRSIPKESE